MSIAIICLLQIAGILAVAYSAYRLGLRDGKLEAYRDVADKIAEERKARLADLDANREHAVAEYLASQPTEKH